MVVFEEFLQKEFGKNLEWIQENIYQKMFEIFGYLIEASKEKLQRTEGMF